MSAGRTRRTMGLSEHHRALATVDKAALFDVGYPSKHITFQPHQRLEGAVLSVAWAALGVAQVISKSRFTAVRMYVAAAHDQLSRAAGAMGEVC